MSEATKHGDSVSHSVQRDPARSKTRASPFTEGPRRELADEELAESSGGDETGRDILDAITAKP
jgi:hypothetical protein